MTESVGDGTKHCLLKVGDYSCWIRAEAVILEHTDDCAKQFLIGCLLFACEESVGTCDSSITKRRSNHIHLLKHAGCGTECPIHEPGGAVCKIFQTGTTCVHDDTIMCL